MQFYKNKYVSPIHFKENECLCRDCHQAEHDAEEDDNDLVDGIIDISKKDIRTCPECGSHDVQISGAFFIVEVVSMNGWVGYKPSVYLSLCE